MKIKITESQYNMLKSSINEADTIESLTQNVNQLISKVNGMYNIIMASPLDELLNYDLIEKYRNQLDSLDSMCSKYEEKLNDLLGDEWEKMPDSINLLYKKTYVLGNALYDIRRIVDRDEEDEDKSLKVLFSDIQTTNIG
jgi:hypothetical protein